MFDQIPLQVWLLVAIGVAAYAPARYIFRFIAHSPSRRDITQPSEDLRWRTSSQLARSLIVVAALAGLAKFIFTPAAAQFARSPAFLPTLIACIGAWALFTVPMGLVNGKIEPFIRGINNTFERKGQPKRYWASLAWNTIVGCFCLWLAFDSYEQASAEVIEDRCCNEQTTYSPQEVILARNELIAGRDYSRDQLGDYVGGRGIGYHRLRDYRHAIADYSEAIRLNPHDYYPHYNRALAYQILGDYRRAVEDFTVAIRLQPNDADAYFNRALIFLETGRSDDAVADFTRAHELEPSNAWPLAYRGIAYAWKRDKARAVQDFDAVRSIDPSNPVMLRGEALLRKDAGDLKGAVDRLTASMVRDPDDLWALRTRSEWYWELGEHEKSAEDDRRWLRLNEAARARRN